MLSKNKQISLILIGFGPIALGFPVNLRGINRQVQLRLEKFACSWITFFSQQIFKSFPTKRQIGIIFIKERIVIL
jgi:hypothetical protein